MQTPDMDMWTIARWLRHGRRLVTRVWYIKHMSYDLTLQCGCVVGVSCDPAMRGGHTRMLRSRGASCVDRRHEIGARVYLWELLPDPTHRAAPDWAYPVSRSDDRV